MERNVDNESSSLLAHSSQSIGYGSRTTDQEDQPQTMGQSTVESRTLPQYIAALAATGGALAAGVLLGWTSPAEPRIVKEDANHTSIDGEYGFPIDEDQFSWVASIVTLGAAFVCLPIGILINVLGRKISMLLLVLPFTLGWALLIWAQNIEMMYVSRFILGISGGAFCVTAPMYTGEIAQKEIRGSLGSYFQLMVTVGILFVYIVGWKLSVFVMSLIGGAIPLVFGVIFVFMPETPAYLVSKGKIEKAIDSMKWLRGAEYDYSNELAELQEEDARNKANPVNVFSALVRRVTLKALFVSLGLMFFQQLSGINAVIFYTNPIFQKANTGIEDAVASILVGVMQVIATLVSSMVVDKLGRRLLLISSGLLMAVCTILMGVYFFMQNNDEHSVSNIGWLPIASLCVFIIMFSLGYGPVPWLMMGELFPSDIKGVAGSIAGTLNWTLAFIVTKTFKNLNDSMGIGPTFWLFSCISLVGVLFVYFFVPETKGRSLIEIQKMLEGEKTRPLDAQQH